jgi:hypothetical protein
VRTDIGPVFPHLTLTETEPVRLSPYVRSGSSKRKDAPSLSVLDFVVSDAERPLFHIEQKTGPGSIDEMSEFQLDLNDYNDLVGATNKTGLPTYIIHVQAGQEYLFPPPQFKATPAQVSD